MSYICQYVINSNSQLYHRSLKGATGKSSTFSKLIYFFKATIVPQFHRYIPQLQSTEIS